MLVWTNVCFFGRIVLMETKRIVASAVALTMSLSMLASGCSIINPAGGNPEVKEAAETYIAKLL